MISRFPLAIRSLSPSIYRRLLLLRLLRRHSSSCAAAVSISSSVAAKPRQTPLFLRPLTHSASPSDLLAFRRYAQSLASASADADHLTRELTWMLEDATSSEHGSAEIQLRVPLEELYLLWRERIEDRRPLQYIVGCEHWRDLVLAVREGVLIPRPETEAVVDLVSEVGGFEEGLWADLGTGSGAIAVGIARILGDGGRVYATDLSLDAVEVAMFNVERYGLQDKVEIRQGSWFEPLQDVKGKLAGLTSNPPYIPSDQISGLQAEVGRHEPRLALDGGNNGMNHLLHLCEGSASALKSGGFFAFETNGNEQSEFIADLMSSRWGNLFHGVKEVSDFAGIKRFVTGFRR